MPAERNQGDSHQDYTVFISHAGSDTWVAKKLAQSIEEIGASTFLDEAHIFRHHSMLLYLSFIDFCIFTLIYYRI